MGVHTNLQENPMKLDVAIMTSNLQQALALAQAAETTGFSTLWMLLSTSFLCSGCGK